MRYAQKKKYLFRFRSSNLNLFYSAFKYDPFGRRIEKRAEYPVDGVINVKVHTYVYDNEDIILETVDTTVNGSTTTETITYVHGPGVDEPLMLQKGGANYYYHADALGSIAELTDSSQTVVESYRYTAFGVTTKFGNTVNNSFRFTGREFDSEIGVYYYRARYYDPNIGRFISKDPIGIAGGDVNLFNYVLGNPVNWVDPEGLINVSPGGYNNPLGSGPGGYFGGGGGGARITVRGNIANKLSGPKFPYLKTHAKNHGGMHPHKYYNDAVKNIDCGRKFTFYHNGQKKIAHITRIDESSFNFTSTNMSQTTIFTHMSVKETYLNNLGITLPNGF